MDKDKCAEEDALEQVVALPYDAFISGPPKVPCDAERAQYVADIGIADKPPDPQVEHILTLVSHVFSVPNVLVSLCAHERVFIRNAKGFSAGAFPWRWGFCGWGIATSNPEVLVVPDAREDARMRGNQAMVTSELQLRFFAGVPLIGSSGHRLGMLILIDDQPRQLTDQQCAILVNMSELVVRELEKEAAAAAKAAAILAAGREVTHYMRRALSSFDTRAVLFVDVKTESPERPWQALHCNSAMEKATGISYTKLTTTPLLELFVLPFEPDSEPCQAMVDVAARGDEFVVRGVHLADEPQRGTFSLMFRPGRMGALDEDTQLVGVPSTVPSAPADTPAEYFFVIVSPDNAAQPSPGPLLPAQAINVRRNVAPTNVPIEGLELGPLLGKGSFGRVYRARFHGKPVAVKICSCILSARGNRTDRKPWRSVEAVQARHLSHPSVMRTFKRTTVLVQDSGEWRKLGSGSSSGSGGFRSDPYEDGDKWGDDPGWSDDDAPKASPPREAELETWLMLEYCNRGSLQNGIDRGWFQAERNTHGRGPPSLPTLLHTAHEICDAMAYLHNCDIIHGDLCGGNILLTSTDALPHHFTCKVADFGLSRDLELKTRLQTAHYGTVTHMPPELLIDGKLSKAADVYAFGILLWEMACGTRAWSGMSHTQVLTAVGYHHRQPQFPDIIDKDIVALAQTCLDQHADKRPTFQQALAAVEEMLWLVMCAEGGEQQPEGGGQTANTASSVGTR